LERLYFRFQFSFVLFAAIYGWTPTNFFWRRHTPFFIAKNTPVFTLIVQRVFSFSSTTFSFCFFFDFCSDLVISLYQSAFRPLVYVGFHQKSCFKKVWMVLEKKKKFHDYSGTNGSLFRLRLRLLHIMLDVVLIVWLVVFAVAWLVSNDWDCLMSLWKNHALFYYMGACYCGFLLWCFIWVDLAHAYNMFDSSKSPYSLYVHLVFDLWYHFMLWLMMFCRYAWLWPLLLS
jgi:hypothetical protein